MKKFTYKQLSIISSFLLVITLLVTIFSRDINIKDQIDLHTPTEHFIWNEMALDNGLLKTTYKSTDHDYALSESLGLTMIYAIKTDNRSLFDQSYNALTNYFLSRNGLVYWRLKWNGEHKEKVNAFLDDLRIINSLLEASEKWEEPSFKITAKIISDALLKFTTLDNMYVDFYDWGLKKQSQSFTVTYLDLSSIRRLYKLGWINEPLVRNMEDLAEQATKLNHPFFPKTYQVKQKKFEFEKNVNMTEQVYTAYHFSKAGLDTNDFYQLLKNEFEKYGKLFGQYDAVYVKPVVEFESPALYGISILYALRIGDRLFAKELYTRMKEFQVKEGQFEGGYMDLEKMDTHIFDNLFPLIAERSLINAEDNRE